MGAATVTPLGLRRENLAVTGEVSMLRTYACNVQLSASYGPGGDTANVSAGLPSKCYGAIKGARTVLGDHKYTFEVHPAANYAPTAVRIIAVDTTTGAPPAATTDLSGETVTLIFYGR